MIGANFPDIDVLSIPFGRAAEFRRGWTHGIPALIVLPFVLTALVIAWDRYVRRSGSRGRAPVIPREPAPVVPRELLMLSAISILTHPTLDWMNSYGMRWLMPFSGRWFYGDSLFIIDPWLLIVLGLGVGLSARRERRRHPRAWRPARVALAVAVTYIVVMMGLHEAAERVARRELAGNAVSYRRLVVAPFPANPALWSVYADDGARYSPYLVSLAPGSLGLTASGRPIETNAADPAAIAAARSELGRRFLGWARLPYYRVTPNVNGTRVAIIDARYGAAVVMNVD